MKKRELICIVCPRGCSLDVSLGSDGEVLSIKGNACKRGAVYAENECTHPVRVVTSTMKCEDGGIISVKTSEAIPKEKIFEVMDAINSTRAKSEVKIGDTVISRVCSLDADIVATSSKIV